MPIYTPEEIQQVCTQCSWKNPHIEHTDCFMFHYSECPKCKGKREY